MPKLTNHFLSWDARGRGGVIDGGLKLVLTVLKLQEEYTFLKFNLFEEHYTRDFHFQVLLAFSPFLYRYSFFSFLFLMFE